MKTNQMKFDITNNIEKAKYYTAFSYLNVRPLFKAKLFEFFDYDIKRAFNADKNDLTNLREYYDITIPKDFLEKRDKLNIEKCYTDAFLDKEVKLLTYEDEKYPQYLKEIPDFPLSLFYKGNLDLLEPDFNLAVVGSRNASQNALLALDSIISNFKNSNITIVSGLAYGIDTQAHKSAIENNLKTIAVVGCGLDIVYPSQNKKLFEDIKNTYGIIFSEYPLKTQPLSYNFPQRNRIVVGMSKGTLVAEAQIKSGAMISANLTLDYNRELMCIPGNILNPNTSGIYHLIKNGAGIVSDAKDLLNYMDWDIILNEEKFKDNNLDGLQKEILDILALEDKSFDEIINITNSDTSQIMITLTELELKGLIKQSNNKYYKCK
ncbi:MAG: DNA-processing protein DprA [Candidatus Gastranaerophilales bacterium]|nr:DNA-processing protein DprA [Candidatus Gastranaerophilales bacterium]